MCSYEALRQMKLSKIRKIINKSKNELIQVQKSPPNLVNKDSFIYMCLKECHNTFWFF